MLSQSSCRSPLLATSPWIVLLAASSVTGERKVRTTSRLHTQSLSLRPVGAVGRHFVTGGWREKTSEERVAFVEKKSFLRNEGDEETASTTSTPTTSETESTAGENATSTKAESDAAAAKAEDATDSDVAEAASDANVSEAAVKVSEEAAESATGASIEGNATDVSADAVSSVAEDVEDENEDIELTESVNLTSKALVDDIMEDRDTVLDVATAVSVALLGVLSIVSILLAFSSSAIPQRRQATWEVLDGALGAVSSLLLFQAVGQFCLSFSGSGAPHGIDANERSSAAGVGLLTFLLVAGMAGLSPFLRVAASWRWPEALKVCGDMAGFFLAYLGSAAFGNLLRLDVYSASARWVLLSWIPGLIGITIGVGFLGVALRNMVFSADRGEAADMWKSQAAQAENIYVGLTSGFLVSVGVRYLITGEVPPVNGQPAGKSQSQCGLLGVCALSSFVLQIVLSQLFSWLAGARCCRMCMSRPAVQRILALLLEIWNMATGWLMFFACNWIFWNLGIFVEGSGETVESVANEMVASMVVGLFFSLLTFVAILVSTSYPWPCCTVATTAGVLASFMRCLGFTWEQALVTAVDSVARSSSYGGVVGLVAVTLRLLMFAVIFPVWMFYALPFACGLHRSTAASPGMARNNEPVQAEEQRAGVRRVMETRQMGR